ncbi:CHASE3 domain-containing protein [Sphingomonas sp. H160509]|uniref:CHASE3 domain-containing protein n=1 Tax=Sphingomonas sp. H160509 TaxID=2955313 RepID=UPI003157FDFB
MFVSLTARITAIGLIVLLALASLAGLLADASYQASQSVHWAAHSAGIIETTEAALGDLREAESGQRGFVITRDPAYARSYAERVDSAARTIARVVEQTDDNPLQHARAKEIALLMKERSAFLLQPLNLARRGDFSGAVAVIASGRGRELMDAISVRAQGFLDEERALQSTRQDAAVQRLESGKRLAILGAIAVALVVVGSFALLVRAIRRPLATMMRAMTALGSGEQDARIDTAMGSREFARLAVGYNAMADRLRGAVADQGHQRAAITDRQHRTRAEHEVASRTRRGDRTARRHGASHAGRAHRRRIGADHSGVRTAGAPRHPRRAVRAQQLAQLPCPRRELGRHHRADRRLCAGAVLGAASRPEPLRRRPQPRDRLRACRGERGISLRTPCSRAARSSACSISRAGSEPRTASG